MQLFRIECTKEEQFVLKNKLLEKKVKYDMANSLTKGKTPYKSLCAFTINLEEREVSRFLEAIKEVNTAKNIRLYSEKLLRQPNRMDYPYYSPYILLEKEYAYLKTTFFYQKLSASLEFLDDIELEEKVEVFPNFLEFLEITEEENNRIVGNYQTAVRILESGENTNEDFGEFEITCKQEQESFKVNTNITNYRKRVRIQNSLYDYLFKIPMKNGKSNFQVTEYYVTKGEDTVLHFIEDSKVIELYQKEEGKMRTSPFKILSKANPKDEEEQEIVEEVNCFLEKQEVLVRKLKKKQS